MDQERIFFLGGLLCSVAAGIYVFWGPVWTSKNRKVNVGGLVNLGYSCFLNALLQAFGSCPHIRNWLSRNDHESKELIRALHVTLEVINKEHLINCDPFVPSAVMNALKRNLSISPGEHDSHEFFCIIVSALENELLQTSHRFSLYDALDVPTPSVEPTSAPVDQNDRDMIGSSILRRISRQQRLTGSFVHNFSTALLPPEKALPFHGLLASSLECTVCKNKNVVQCDKFVSLSLPLPDQGKIVHTLEQLIESFFATETVEMDCDKCKMPRVDVYKTFSLAKLPDCLCIHIVRTTWLPDGMSTKRMDHVDFDEILVLDNYTYAEMKCDTVKQRYTYELKAVVVHRGDQNHGHFVTYRRWTHGWVLTSDDLVFNTLRAKAFGAPAYMLFYDKIRSEDCNQA